MPTYLYLCPSCGHEYEKLQKISDETRVKCPECDTPGERQISGGAGLVFKGSGFYITDYGKKSGEPKGEGDSASKGDAKSKGEKSSDSKDSSKSDKKTKGDSS